MYSPLVRKGGIIAFHDIVPFGYPTVYKFWNEVKEKYEYLEIIKNRNQNCYGTVSYTHLTLPTNREV